MLCFNSKIFKNSFDIVQCRHVDVKVEIDVCLYDSIVQQSNIMILKKQFCRLDLFRLDFFCVFLELIHVGPINHFGTMLDQFYKRRKILGKISLIRCLKEFNVHT